MECPHCHQQGVSIWAKLMAGTALPAKCKHCGKPSSISGWLLGLEGIAYQLIILAGAITSFIYSSWWPVVISTLIYVSVLAGTIRWAPLIALSDKQVKKTRIFSYVFIAIIILLVIFAGITDR